VGVTVGAVQRLVARMTIDPSFAAAVLRGERDAELPTEALRWIREVDPRAWGAERGRAAQLLGNVAAEFPLAVRLAAPGVLEGFASSDELHHALATDASLPLAFADRLLAHAAAPIRDVTRLEVEMAQVRRLAPERPAAPVRLAAGVRLLALTAGTVAWASAASGAADPGIPPVGSAREIAVLAPRGGTRWRRPDVRVEVVAGPVHRLLARAAIGMHAADIGPFGEACDASPAEVRALLADLVADGIVDPAAVDV
jgi:hypothetical protein